MGVVSFLNRVMGLLVLVVVVRMGSDGEKGNDGLVMVVGVLILVVFGVVVGLRVEIRGG